MNFNALKFLPELLKVFGAVRSVVGEKSVLRQTLIILRPSYRSVNLQITVERV